MVTGGHLFGYQIPRLDLKFKFEHKESGNIYRVALNEHPDAQNQLVIVNKKKKVKCFEYNPEITKLIEMKIEDLVMLDLTDSIGWYGNIFCYATKKKVFFINVTDGLCMTQPLESNCVKSVSGSWLIYTDCLGVFITETNSVKTQNPMYFSPKTLINIGIYKNFVISLHDSLICFFDANDSSQIQEIQFEHGSVGKFLAVGQKRLFYVLNSYQDKSSACYQIWELKELAFEKQISKLLNEDKIEEALNILNNNISSSSEEKPKRIEQFFIDCSWTYLKKSDFDNAYKYGKLANFNPYEFIYLFRNILGVKIYHEEIKELDKKGGVCIIESITQSNDNMLNDSLKMLMDLLQDKRNLILNTYEIPKDNLKRMFFITSEHALINLSNSKTDFPLYSIFEIINTTLIKINVRRKENMKKVWEIIDYQSFSCDWEDLENFLIKESNDESRIAYAYINEKRGKFSESLKIWQEYGNKDNSNNILSKEAMERTKTILKVSQDKNLFHEYIQWVIVKYPKEAFDLFMSTEIVNVDYFFSTIISAVDKTNPHLNLKEKFLEFYIENGCNTERHHTILSELYVDKIFKIKKPDTTFESSLIDGNLKLYLDKFDKLIKTSHCYNKNHILDKVRSTWMIEQEIYLYSKLSLHNDALNKLVSIGIQQNDFSKAEKYCQDIQPDKPDIFADLFKILAENYQLNSSGVKTGKNDNEKKIFEKIAITYQKEMLNILKKFGDSQTLDPFVVLQQLPSDWTIADQSLYEYLTKIMKSYTHMGNKYKIARSLSEMAVIYKEKDLIDAKNKSVNIGNETVCEYCKKKIGNTIFCVYPNMKIYHHKCAQSPNICPTSRIDFSKKQYL